MKFEIGQTVFRASWEPTETHVTCPECAGEGRMRVILPDEAIVSIECEGCKRGFEGPKGYLVAYDRAARVLIEVITGMEIRDGKTEWATTGTYRASEDDLFISEEEARTRAIDLAAEVARQERERINQKEKSTRSWSWHVHYHRREIREAERRIEYHRAKLAVANLKAKTDKAASLSSAQETYR
jgi:hypothetical protein